MSSKKHTISLMAAAMAISLAPVPASGLASHEPTTSQHNITSLSFYDVTESVNLLPITKAVSYLQDMTARMRNYRANIQAEWELKNTPILMKNQNKEFRDSFKLLFRYIEMCDDFTTAARIALQDIPVSQKKQRENVILFAKSSAALRYIIEDILNFVNSTIPQKNDSKNIINVTTEQVHNLIRSEHKKLGLDEPHFC